MLIRTHFAVTIFFVLLFLDFASDKLLFAVAALAAVFIPDIDSRFATLGKRKIARLFQIFTRHRGMTHSFSFLLSVTFILALIFPKIAPGFFLGYGLHLFADSFTPEGIQPFYPWKKKSRGKIPTGSRRETIVFVIFIIGILALLTGKIFA